MITCIQDEIVQLHRFFQDWYNNQLSPTDENFSRCGDVLDPDFSIIFPSGEIVHYQPLVDGLRKAHNSRHGMHIWIKNVQMLHHIGEIILATYEEWQEIDGHVTARLSSVIFQEAQSKPNGVRWLHVHETWINP